MKKPHKSKDIGTSLFGKGRRNVLGVLFTRGGTAMYLREIAAVGGGQGQVQRELENLHRAGLIRRDPGALMLALRQVARVRGGIAEIARRSQLTREATYRILSEQGNPELKSLTALLAATGLRLSVKPITGAKRP